MFVNDFVQEAAKHPSAANNLKKNSVEPKSIHEEPSARLSSARRMHWATHESEVMARVWREVDKPRLTKSVRDALESEGERAAEALARYSKIA